MLKSLIDFFKLYMEQSLWEDENVPEQARALFTTILLTSGIDADTGLCDRLLHISYLWMGEKTVPFEDYENFMLEFVV